MKPLIGIYFLAVLAALLPWLNRESGARSAAQTAQPFDAWPSGMVPAEAVEVPLAPRDARFAEDFPGKIAEFMDGSRICILRWVTQPTRRLHSASDCFRGAGYQVTPGNAWRDEFGRTWATFSARRDSERFRVRERISSREGSAWTDVSAWYWSVLFRRSRAPWIAETVVEKQ